MNKTNDYEISQDTRFKLFKFYELLGEYDKAENELIKLKGLNYFKIEVEGLQFYRKLDKLSDIDLKKGNLSKEEVAKRLAEYARE